MKGNSNSGKKRVAAVVAVASIVVVIFLCIFSLYHLPERDPVETPIMAENPNYVESPVEGFEETNDIMSSSRQQVSEMLGDLEMQYENAKLNSEPYMAQQAGLRLVMAYWKAGQPQQAKDLANTLIQNYSYDETFVAKCKAMLEDMNK